MRRSPSLHFLSLFAVAALITTHHICCSEASTGTPSDKRQIEVIVEKLQQRCDKNCMSVSIAREAECRGQDTKFKDLTVFRAQAMWALATFLEQKNENCRTAAIMALCELYPASRPALHKALKSGDVLTRLGAMRALGGWRLGPKADHEVPLLIESLQDSNALIRAKAAETLGKIGAGASAAAPKLVDKILDANLDVRMASIKSLGELGVGSDRVIRSLLSKLEAPEDECIQAIRALGQLGSKAAFAAPTLAERLSSSYSKYRKKSGSSDLTLEISYSIRALGKIGQASAPAVDTLIDIARHEVDTPYLVMQAMEALGRIGQPAGRAAPVMVDNLRRFYGVNFDLGYSYSAIIGLGDLGPWGAQGVPILRSVLLSKGRSSRRDLRCLAQQALLKIDTPEARQAIEAAGLPFNARSDCRPPE